MTTKPAPKDVQPLFSSFPFLGDGKLENSAQLFAAKELRVSQAFPSESDAENRNSQCECGGPIAIVRRYEASPEVLGLLVEALYTLVMDRSASASEDRTLTTSASCFSRPAE